MNKPISTGAILPIGENEVYNVYNIPIEILKPNPQNDRIASKIREIESTNEEFDINNQKDVNDIFNLIWDEHLKDNKNTMKDIAKKGQLIHGVVTKDGLIIDGNRRATILKKLYEGEAETYEKDISSFKYFKAVVLKDELSKSNREIRALETKIQIGSDEKVGYDPINIYIKIENLIKVGYNEDQIANFMNESVKKIQAKREVFKRMISYLDFHNSEDRFSLLDNLEDQFINVNKIFSKIENNDYAVDWEILETDKVFFKEATFEILRSKPEGKNFRTNFLGKPKKPDGIFAIKEAWDTFLRNHKEIMEKHTFEKESDWKARKEEFKGNLRRVRKAFGDDLEGLNINDRIDELYDKAKRLENLINYHDEIKKDKRDVLKETEKVIRTLAESFTG
jgi:hypothetical protein